MSMTTTERMDLGVPVRFTHVLERRNIQVRRYGGSWEKHWLPVERAGEGVLVGYRTQMNGYTDYDEGSAFFVATDGVRCALVATSLYRNPVRVPLDALSAA